MTLPSSHSSPSETGKDSLSGQAGLTDAEQQEQISEEVWIDVIHKMDAVYADLVHSQVELEEKNIALEEAQQFISSVLSSMTDVLIVCDIKGRIQQVNRVLETLTCRPKESLIHQPLSLLFAEESKFLVDSFPDKLGSESIIDCEVKMLDCNGQQIPLAMNCSSRYEHDGRLLGMVLIGRPLGELRKAYSELAQAHDKLKQTQLQLVQSEKMASLGRLVAGVAHELNNPISFVFGNMHALARYEKNISTYIQAIDEKEQSQSLQELRKELKIDRIMNDIVSLIDGTLEGAERVKEIVQDLRRYSGNQKETASQFDLSNAVNTALEWVTKACRIKPRINLQLAEQVSVFGRKGQVHQILVNLIQNAVDVMENQEHQQVNITTIKLDDSILIQVQDRGPGIPDQALPKVFDPFFTTKDVGKGTGLGLYISYGIAKDMDGDLTAQNHPDGGALFTLTIPLKGEQTE